MKLFICTLYCCVGYIALGQVDDYKYFPTSNSTWVSIYRCPPPSPVSYCNYIKYDLNGDTVINAVLYNKIFKTEYDIFCDTLIVNSASAYGFIRQNIQSKEVYYLTNTGVDTLLYTFNLNVGDTFPLTYINPSLKEVVSIDSFMIGTEYHKTYLIQEITPQFGGPFTLVEGVGSLSGLLDVMVSPNSFLRCFERGDTLFYSSDSTDFSCNSPVDTCKINGIGAYDSDSEKYFISPNPLATTSKIFGLGNYLFEVYDLFGHRILSMEKFNNEEFFLNRSEFRSSGIYLCLFHTRDGRLFKFKLVLI